ncbi:hypothetical protein [Mycobacterium intracellulare]|uniref:Uncharacterized protein n=1 Tax=Mycobacterium intracellulare TaxID=1767 RepID=A0AAE4RI95_MYCIT|nr:hypothetical protein [Mycobacterium intracellulare]MDV6979105.1 hypothetical protein [Mycobacterium intracellulare]MDV6984513.1 hypothetical protein [Mycobacterium intracellulare]MDV7014589.1 hypothetical protein [Mycobacterium intracellulare]MDV7029505.1 hypothetical protein [Mycobacterium intracellulare]
MALDVPDDAPRHRFMRYVRPPADQPSAQRGAGPLFPLRPNTRKLRVAVDVETLGEPTQEIMRVLTRDEEVEPLLLVQNEGPEPTPWMQALGIAQWYQSTFTTVAEAPKFMDSSTVGVSGYEGGRKTLTTSGHFFSVYALLDEAARAAYSDDAGITLADRHRAAALASASGAIEADVIVTAAPTVGRDDVADNDRVVSLTPTQLIPLFGHYLRMTGNSVLTTIKGQLVGGGTFLQTLNATSVADLYLAGINASTPHLNAIQLMATLGGDRNLVRSMEAIALRLSRAARAVDHLLAALSNGTSTDKQRSDTSETAAEALDRMLLYLCAAMDRYARVIRTLFDTALDPENQRCSLTSTDELRSIIAKFEPTDTVPLECLGSYAWVIGKLRNRIHSLPLDTHHQLSRSYGSSTTVAMTLDGLSELDPASTPLNQDQLDRLGVWNAQSPNPFHPRAYAADIATLATTLFRETLRYVEDCSHFIIRNKPLATITTPRHPVLGCWADDPRPMPDAMPNELVYREMLGWAEFG